MNDDVNIQALVPDVPLAHLPSQHQHRLWGRYVDYAEGADPDGGFLGQCALDTTHSAVYNFSKGIMRCEAEPSCHPRKRAMSLDNVLAAVAVR